MRFRSAARVAAVAAILIAVWLKAPLHPQTPGAVRTGPAFPRLVEFVLGKTGVPWTWEYGAMSFLTRP